MLAELQSSLPRGTSARASFTLCLRRNTPRSLRTGTQDRIPRVSSCVHFDMSTALRSSLFHEATTYRASCCPRATTNVPRPIWIQPFPNAVHADGCSQPRTVFRGVPDASIPLFSFALAHQSLYIFSSPQPCFQVLRCVLPLDLCRGKIPEERFGTKCVFRAPSQSRCRSPECCLSHSRVRFLTEVRLTPNPASLQSAKRLR